MTSPQFWLDSFVRWQMTCKPRYSMWFLKTKLVWILLFTELHAPSLRSVGWYTITLSNAHTAYLWCTQFPVHRPSHYGRSVSGPSPPPTRWGSPGACVSSARSRASPPCTAVDPTDTDHWCHRVWRVGGPAHLQVPSTWSSPVSAGSVDCPS